MAARTRGGAYDGKRRSHRMWRGPYPLRMPDELRQRLEARAKDTGRSVNAEIITILTAALDGRGLALGDLSGGALLDEVIERYGARLHVIVSPEVASEVGIGDKVRLDPRK